MNNKIILKKSQAIEYIKPGTILTRNYNNHKERIKVTSKIFSENWSDDSKHRKFNCIINENIVSDYYVSDLFNGEVTFISKSVMIDKLSDEEFKI